MEYKELVSVFEKLYKYCNTQKQVNTLTSKIYAALKSQSSKRKYELGLINIPDGISSFFENDDFDLNECKSVKYAYEESLR